MPRIPPLSILACCGLLAACVGPIGNDRVDWDHGARHGRILALLAPATAAAEAHACLGSAPLPAGFQFVRVRYRRSRLQHEVLAMVPERLAVRIGDEVELWPDDCAQGRLARAERVLAPLAADR